MKKRSRRAKQEEQRLRDQGYSPSVPNELHKQHRHNGIKGGPFGGSKRDQRRKARREAKRED
jgi:hypothetical protein